MANNSTLLEQYIAEASTESGYRRKNPPAASVLNSQDLARVRANPINKKIKETLQDIGYKVDEFWQEGPLDNGWATIVHGNIEQPELRVPKESEIKNKVWTFEGPLPIIMMNPDCMIGRADGWHNRRRPFLIVKGGTRATTKEDIRTAKKIVSELNKLWWVDLEIVPISNIRGGQLFSQ